MKNLIADKVNCTYWWIMYMDANNPENAPGVREMHGYSKFQYQAEANDKMHVFMAKIEMLAKNGYLKKATHIEIYMRQAPLPSKSQDRHIVTLFQTHYTMPPKSVTQLPNEIFVFLKKFYAVVNNGGEVKGLRPLPKKDYSKDEQITAENIHFTSFEQLYKHATKLIANGEAPGMVENFIRKNSEKLSSRRA